MNVVLYGATGISRRRILKELMSRGHSTTAVARNKKEIPAGVVFKQDDLSDADTIASLIAGSDAVISAYNPPQDDTDALVGVTKRQIAAVKKNGDIRLIVVRGAGSLEVTPGVTLLASGHLPPSYVAIATSHGKSLEALRASDINWTYLSPAAFFQPGERTGDFRLGRDELISDANRESRISVEDYAIALAGC